MQRAAEILEQEHRLIQKAVAVMSLVADELEGGNLVDSEILNQLIQFMRVFGDQCHHGKEEKYLFPLLESKGVPANGCPLAALAGDHRKGRILLDQFEMASAAYRSNAESAKPDLIIALRELTELYPGHIWKEEYLLFPMANKILSSADQENLRVSFETVESTIGLDVHHAFESMITYMDGHHERLGKSETAV